MRFRRCTAEVFDEQGQPLLSFTVDNSGRSYPFQLPEGAATIVLTMSCPEPVAPVSGQVYGEDNNGKGDDHDGHLQQPSAEERPEQDGGTWTPAR